MPPVKRENSPDNSTAPQAAPGQRLGPVPLQNPYFVKKIRPFEEVELDSLGVRARVRIAVFAKDGETPRIAVHIAEGEATATIQGLGEDFQHLKAHGRTPRAEQPIASGQGRPVSPGTDARAHAT